MFKKLIGGKAKKGLLAMVRYILNRGMDNSL